MPRLCEYGQNQILLFSEIKGGKYWNQPRFKNQQSQEKLPELLQTENGLVSSINNIENGLKTRVTFFDESWLSLGVKWTDVLTNEKFDLRRNWGAVSVGSEAQKFSIKQVDNGQMF